MSDIDIKAVLHEADPKLVERFRKYHSENPVVWTRFKHYTDLVYKTGKRKFSAWAVMNRVRWEQDMEKPLNQEFAISNDFIALYARVMMHVNWLIG